MSAGENASILVLDPGNCRPLSNYLSDLPLFFRNPQRPQHKQLISWSLGLLFEQFCSGLKFVCESIHTITNNYNSQQNISTTLIVVLYKFIHDDFRLFTEGSFIIFFFLLYSCAAYKPIICIITTDIHAQHADGRRDENISISKKEYGIMRVDIYCNIINM